MRTNATKAAKEIMTDLDDRSLGLDCVEDDIREEIQQTIVEIILKHCEKG